VEDGSASEPGRETRLATWIRDRIAHAQACGQRPSLRAASQDRPRLPCERKPVDEPHLPLAERGKRRTAYQLRHREVETAVAHEPVPGWQRATVELLAEAREPRHHGCARLALQNPLGEPKTNRSTCDVHEHEDDGPDPQRCGLRAANAAPISTARPTPTG
jgi:hypothetical protein